jgi:HEAT repeat protein
MILRAIESSMTNQKEIRAIIQGHATRGDIHDRDEGEEFDKAEITLRALQKYGDDLIPTLIESLSDLYVAVRQVAMRLLWEMESDDESVLPAMLRALEDSDKRIRHAAAGYVTRFGGRAKAAIPTLQSWIAGIDEMSRILAAGSILLIDKSQTDALLPLLIEALEFDGLEQWQAIIQLESLGELAMPAVPALERLVDEGDTTISWQASDALYEITGDDSSVHRVGHRLLRDPDELVRVVAVEHLMQLGKDAVPTLEKMAVLDESDLVRGRARAALDEIEESI